MTDEFSSLSPADQRTKLRKVRDNADWEAADGPLGGVIRHLRDRAEATRKGARLFLRMLVATVIVGIGFYLFPPIAEILFDGRKGALIQTLAGIEARKQELDSDRAALLLGEKLQDGTEVPGLPALLEDAFVAVPSEAEDRLGAPIIHEDQLFVFGEFGSDRIAHRLAANNSRFEVISIGAETWDLPTSFDLPIVHGDRLLVFGDDGTALRLAMDGSRFEKISTGTANVLHDVVVHRDRLFVFGEYGRVIRLAADGFRIEDIPTGTGASLYGSIVHGDRLFVFGGGGTALRLTADGSQFEELATGTEASLYNPIIYGDRLFVFGDLGTALRLAADGSRFEAVATGTDAPIGFPLGIPIVHRDRLFVFGHKGTALRLATDGSRFEAVPTGNEYPLNFPMIYGDHLFVFGQDRTALRLAADGSKFEAVAYEGVGSAFGAIIYENRLFAFGDYGTALVSTDTFATAAALLPPGSDAISRASVDHFFDTELPDFIREWEPTADIRNSLNLIESEYAVLDHIEARTQTDLGYLEANPLQYLRDRKALDFKGFLDGCRGTPPTPDLTTACLSAWQSEETAGQRSWWETLADQLPPGILLLFLLATLGGLYRYNVRLAGFHDSRADFLTLITHGRSEKELRDILAKTTGDAQNLVALVLAADKVEMGTIRAKLGQAEIELAKALGADKSEG